MCVCWLRLQGTCKNNIPIFTTTSPVETQSMCWNIWIKGLIDFGLLFRKPDKKKYEWLPLPVVDTWGVLMRRDTPLARKAVIRPEDLWNCRLSSPIRRGGPPSGPVDCESTLELNVVATYNLVFNASLLVDEGLGYALCFDKLIHTDGTNLCFPSIFSHLRIAMLYCLEEISDFLQGSRKISSVRAESDLCATVRKQKLPLSIQCIRRFWKRIFELPPSVQIQ